MATRAFCLAFHWRSHSNVKRVATRYTFPWEQYLRELCFENGIDDVMSVDD